MLIANKAVLENRDLKLMPNLQSAKQIPGLRSLSMAHVILEYAQGLIQPQQALIRLIAIQRNFRLSSPQAMKAAENFAKQMTFYQGPRPAILQILKDTLKELENALSMIKTQTSKINSTSILVLENEAIQFPIERLTKFLASTEFVPPRKPPRPETIGAIDVLSGPPLKSRDIKCSALFIN